MDLKKLWDIPPWEWPDDAGEMLLGALGDDDVADSDRLLAAEMASSVTVMNDNLAETLLAIVRNPAEGEALRGTAAISLGPILEYLEPDGYVDTEDDLVSERTVWAIRDSLHEVYLDADVPKEVRRRVLEASVRTREDWHPGAVLAAYHRGDKAWGLTAVFCMTYVTGFDDEILEALESEDPAIHYQAVRAAGSSAVDAAWPHIRALVGAEEIDKPLLLAAIDAAASIRPEEVAESLGHLAESEDEEIADAIFEALAIAEGLAGDIEPWDVDELDGGRPPMGPHGNGDGGGTAAP